MEKLRKMFVYRKRKMVIHFLKFLHFKICFYIFLGWYDLGCETLIKENDDGVQFSECSCKNLSPTTVVSDIENIFSNSKVGEVFSDQGLE